MKTRGSPTVRQVRLECHLSYKEGDRVWDFSGKEDNAHENVKNTVW